MKFWEYLNLGRKADQIIEAVNNPVYKAHFADLSGIGADVISKIQGFRIDFLGLHLSATPSFQIFLYCLVPVFAGLSALALCIFPEQG